MKLWDKIKAKFHKNDCGCESSCNSCGGGCGGGCGGAITTVPPAEAIPAKPAPGNAMPKPMGSVMNGGMIVTPVVAPRLTNEQPF